MQARSILLERLRTDLVGPTYGEKEAIEDRPSDRYLTAMLFPQNARIAEEEDEEIEDVQSGRTTGADTDNTGGVAVSRTARPATAGISFALVGDGPSAPRIVVSVSVGVYRREWSDETADPDEKELGREAGENGIVPVEREVSTAVETEADVGGSFETPKSKRVWRRSSARCWREVILDQGVKEIDLGQEAADGEGVVPGLGLFVRTLEIDDQVAVTVQAINRNRQEIDGTRAEAEEKTFFQFEMSVEPVGPSELVPRPVADLAIDEDSKTAALIYRRAVEFATGHTCSADWRRNGTDNVSEVSTSWIPDMLVKSVDPDGDPVFARLYAERGLSPPTAEFLAEADVTTLGKTLGTLADAYEVWLDGETEKVPRLSSEDFKKQADKHLIRCRTALERMRDGISLLTSDILVRRAFQTANAAMAKQASWGRPPVTDDDPLTQQQELKWRPFQLGFALMCIRSFQERDHEDRRILDLIWFPTGGGKTEAYLLVAAFVLFYRRLTDRDKVRAYGTAVVMRYTLRTLTIQQFQRAAALICACELMRRGELNADGELGTAVFSIGLWVGQGSTPNDSKTAIKVLHSDNESTPKQIEVCPACRNELLWEVSEDKSSFWCRCGDDDCVLSEWSELPILTVDDRIYRTPPSLLVGTIDKFAQLVRRGDVGVLFGRNTERSPPDLIIQDELHLISGPLGTLAGIYETVVDHLCTNDGIAPKVIGSTATIRRAEEQVGALFRREAFQFPPPAIDGENSGFAKTDEESPGRRYVGMTTAGRTDKYMLQAVCASLLQAALDPRMSDEDRDPYGTLVAYFNSLRILGGALVAMQDDVTKSIGAFSRRRDERPRALSEPEEMTSRKASSEIPKVLRRLEVPFGEPGSIDTLLASNMLSVGVDIPRLGLMVVNGQPKTMSEYIQSTSRVGRQRVPGLVVTIYNNSKPRDRAHYETFRTWHSSLYRSIEATSVTPFASRARDKALHAALVGLARHAIPGFENPTLTGAKKLLLDKEIVPIILSRVAAVDDRELDATRVQLERLLEEWEDRGELKSYWSDWRFRQSLLISAEKAAARKASGFAETAAWETPNSMRNVEPGVDFQLWESAELNRNR